MEGAEVTDTTLVFPNAEVRNCDLAETILGEDGQIEDLDIAGALIDEGSSCERYRTATAVSVTPDRFDRIR